REALGRDMVVFGFAFYQGGFQAIEPGRGLRGFQAAPAPAGSLDATLAAAGMPLLALDLHGPAEAIAGRWLHAIHESRSIGSVYADALAANYFGREIASRIYDVLLFVEKTTAAHGLPRSVRPDHRLPAPANLDFEASGGEPVASWEVRADLDIYGYTVKVSRDHPRSGKQCVLVARDARPHYGESEGGLFQRIDAAPFRGKKIRFRAAVRTHLDPAASGAMLWVRVTSNRAIQPVASADTSDHPISSPDWKEYELVADIPQTADAIAYGFDLNGDGKAWIDSVSVEVVP